MITVRMAAVPGIGEGGLALIGTVDAVEVPDVSPFPIFSTGIKKPRSVGSR